MNTIRTLAFLCLPALLASCVTSGDLARIEDRMDTISADGIVTEDERDELRAEIRAVAADVEKRTEDALGGLAEQGGIAGVVTAAGLAFWNAHRNRTRRRDLEAVAAPKE